MSKEMWTKAHETLEEELGREPTEDEVSDLLSFMIADVYDRAKDLMKYGE